MKIKGLTIKLPCREQINESLRLSDLKNFQTVNLQFQSPLGLGQSLGKVAWAALSGVTWLVMWSNHGIAQISKCCSRILCVCIIK